MSQPWSGRIENGRWNVFSTHFVGALVDLDDQSVRDEILDAQIKYQQEQQFYTLLQVFDKYVINPDRPMLDADGLANAMACFGMVIDFNKELQKMIFKKFDLDEEQEIDFMDFSAGLSQLITASDEETLLLLFQIYDFDQDGYVCIVTLSLCGLSILVSDCWNGLLSADYVLT